MRENKTLKLVLCALFTALISAGAFLRVPLPHMPFTLQTLFVLLAGLVLGPKLGAASAAAYAALGLMGLPIFTQGGGLGYVFKPSFGYILGFIFGAYLAGYIARKAKSPSYRRLLAAGLAGLAPIYLLGLVYFWAVMTFYLKTGIGLWALLFSGLFATLPADIALCFASALAAKRFLPLLRGKM